MGKAAAHLGAQALRRAASAGAQAIADKATLPGRLRGAACEAILKSNLLHQSPATGVPGEKARQMVMAGMRRGQAAKGGQPQPVAGISEHLLPCTFA